MKSAEKLIIIVCFLFQGVLCREFSISLPESVEALRGLCVLIPCRFEIEEQYDADFQTDRTGIWTKDGTDRNNNKVFNSKVTKENKIEGEIIGDLHMKNCTTIFYNISVLCSDFSISLPESVEALRGLCVLIPCSFEIEEQYDADLQKDLTGIWFKDDPFNNYNKVFNSKVTKENKIEGKIIGDLRMKNCTTIFYSIRQSDSGEYYFRIETSGKLKYTYASSVRIRVRDVPQVSPSSSCNITQDLILCSCEVHGNPSPKLEWRLSGQTVLPSEATPIQVESVGSTSLRRSSVFSIPHSVKDTPTLQCVGSNNLGNASQVFFFITKAQWPAEG
ncbi:hypothetical protein PGIGA_G00088350 [Pangasianodon gigas]|uniref:Uncharacterized protein n=1 Tax=Pangasianodon gigas TaxID=30993 RepID=A0ACC5XDJ4_PANGG|nr:hypothetical protein [Pangasianodon gigas]